MRIIAVLFCAFVLVGCQHEPPAYESRYTEPPAQHPAATVAVIGDSYTGGTTMGGTGDKAWPILAETQLRRDGANAAIQVGAVGGSGYANSGKSGVFASKISETVRPDDQLVVFFGSRNDVHNIPELPAAVRDALAQARLIAPDARLLVIGPPWVPWPPTPEILQVRDIVRAQAQEAGAAFVDPIAEEWFINRPELISEDGVHPTDAGHAYMAEMIAPHFAAQLAVTAPR